MEKRNEAFITAFRHLFFSPIKCKESSVHRTALEYVLSQLKTAEIKVHFSHEAQVLKPMESMGDFFYPIKSTFFECSPSEPCTN